jgi:hypothetical protein
MNISFADRLVFLPLAVLPRRIRSEPNRRTGFSDSAAACAARTNALWRFFRESYVVLSTYEDALQTLYVDSICYLCKLLKSHMPP